jgi:uncharacterized protein (DUF924 family)
VTDTRSPGVVTDAPWVAAVLGFWFREINENSWFSASESLDGAIRARFRAVHEQVFATAAVDPAPDSPRLALATVIVLDQFSRNMFRGTAQAYASDPVARRVATAAVAGGLDAAMRPEERYFLYLPFEHSEDPRDQARAVTLIRGLGRDSWTKSAYAHQALIERFGRFPHRNAILGRRSTPEELAIIDQPSGSF